MALVQCPECANQVSDQATACPKCGYPLAVSRKPVSPVGPKTAAAPQTSSFWLCPSCGKHVPGRQKSCLCGFVRPETVPVVNPRPVTTLAPQFTSAEDRQGPSWMAITIVLVGGLALARGVYVSMNAGGQAEPKELNLALAAKKQPETPRGADAYFLPPTAAPAGTQASQVQPSAVVPAERQVSGPVSVPQDAMSDQLRRPQEAEERQQRGRLQPPAEPIQIDSATTRMQAGAAEFESVMVVLSKKADQADIAWERFYAGCRQNVLSVTSSAAAGTRAWFSDGTMVTSGAAASTTASISTWTEACAELGVVRSLTKQIQAGMCQAEDEARRSGVYPGTMRALRTKYRLEWEWCR